MGASAASPNLARLRRASLLGRLKLRKKLSNGDLYLDYGWIKLLFSDDGDRQELYYHLNQGLWRSTDLPLFSKYIEPGATVIDVGANMGFVTTMLASLVGPTGLVMSFEPSFTTYEKLLKTIAANDLTQVSPRNMGLGSKRETKDLISISRSSGNNTLLPTTGGSAESRESIELMKLDEASELQDHRVTFIKIDTEGFELQVLDGARELVVRDKPIIYTELGGGGSYTHSTLRVIEFLEEHGYDTSHVSGIDWQGVGNGADFTFVPIEMVGRAPE